MKVNLIILSFIFFIAIHNGTGQKINYEQIATQMLVDSLSDIFKTESGKEFVHIPLCAQFAQTDQFYYSIAAYPIPVSDMSIIDLYFKKPAEEIRNAEINYSKQNTYNDMKSGKPDTLQPLCPDSSDTPHLVYHFKLSEKESKEREKYLLKNCPAYEKYPGKTQQIEIKLTEEQRKKFTQNPEQYNISKGGRIMTFAPKFIKSQDMAIVHIYIWDIIPIVDVFVFMNYQGEIKKYYRFEGCERKKKKTN